MPGRAFLSFFFFILLRGSHRENGCSEGCRELGFPRALPLDHVPIGLWERAMRRLLQSAAGGAGPPPPPAALLGRCDWLLLWQPRVTS